MFKIHQKYVDFDGRNREEDLYFNFTEPQLRQFLDKEPSFNEKNLAEIMATKDLNLMLDAVQTLIISAYGEKTPDGRSFVKNEQIREKFEGSAAFAQLMDDIMYNGNEDMIENFLVNIFPAKFTDSIKEEMAKNSNTSALEVVK
jgi:hypothetical protein